MSLIFELLELRFSFTNIIPAKESSTHTQLSVSYWAFVVMQKVIDVMSLWLVESLFLVTYPGSSQLQLPVTPDSNGHNLNSLFTSSTTIPTSHNAALSVQPPTTTTPPFLDPLELAPPQHQQIKQDITSFTEHSGSDTVDLTPPIVKTYQCWDTWFHINILISALLCHQFHHRNLSYIFIHSTLNFRTGCSIAVS